MCPDYKELANKQNGKEEKLTLNAQNVSGLSLFTLDHIAEIRVRTR